MALGTSLSSRKTEKSLVLASSGMIRWGQPGRDLVQRENRRAGTRADLVPNGSKRRS